MQGPDGEKNPNVINKCKAKLCGLHFEVLRCKAIQSNLLPALCIELAQNLGSRVKEIKRALAVPGKKHA